MLVHNYEKPKVPSRVVILGANGFVGNAIRMRLCNQNINCRSIVRADIDLLKLGASSDLAAELKSDDVLIVAAAVAPCKDAYMLRKNIVILETIIAALSKQPISHLINISSDAVYGDETVPLTENSVREAKNPHAVMHLAREIMFQGLNIPLAIVRPTLIYGSDDPHNGYGPNQFRRLANMGKNIVLFGEGEEERDHIFIGDVAEITSLIIRYKSVGSLNLATGTTCSFKKIADMINLFSGANVAIETVPRKGRMPHNGYRAFDITTIKRAFPQFSYTSLSEGLKKVQEKEFVKTNT